MLAVMRRIQSQSREPRHQANEEKAKGLVETFSFGSVARLDAKATLKGARSPYFGVAYSAHREQPDRRIVNTQIGAS
jgi:hypothetical protein